MKKPQVSVIEEILQKELGRTCTEYQEIVGRGCVNRIFKVQVGKEVLVLRFNDDPSRKLEFVKEKWCSMRTRQLGIPGPEIYACGVHNGYNYMLMEWLEGANGDQINPADRKRAWIRMGEYAGQYHKLSAIEIPEADKLNFHSDWHAQLDYNIRLLESSEKDSLLEDQVFSGAEYDRLLSLLKVLRQKSFRLGLIHKDLSLRNVIIGKEIYLIDWGMAEISIIPQLEIGNAQMEEETNAQDINHLCVGLGLSSDQFQRMKEEIKLLNLLDRLDKYRWASDHCIENISHYEDSIRQVFEQARNLL